MCKILRRVPAHGQRPTAEISVIGQYSARHLLKIRPIAYAVRMNGTPTAQRIVAAARGLLQREGVAAVHMRKVAQLAGISPMGIYRHFANRDALLQRLADDSFDEITRHWLALRSGSDVLAQLIALQRIYLDYALAHPHLFEHAFSSHRGNARRFPEDFHARRSPTLNVGHDAVVAAQAAGVLRAGEPWDIAMTLWAHSHGLIALYRAGRFSFDERRFRAFHEASLHRLLDGLRT